MARVGPQGHRGGTIYIYSRIKIRKTATRIQNKTEFRKNEIRGKEIKDKNKK